MLGNFSSLSFWFKKVFSESKTLIFGKVSEVAKMAATKHKMITVKMGNAHVKIVKKSIIFKVKDFCAVLSFLADDA